MDRFAKAFVSGQPKSPVGRTAPPLGNVFRWKFSRPVFLQLWLKWWSRMCTNPRPKIR